MDLVTLCILYSFDFWAFPVRYSMYIISLVMILHGTTSALDFAVKTMWVPGFQVHTGVMLPDLTSVQLGQDTICIYYVYNDVHTVTYLHCFHILWLVLVKLLLMKDFL